MALPNKNIQNNPVQRVRLWYGALVLVFCLFGLRLFYLQVIQHGHYKAAAQHDQLKQFEVPATRGIIKAHDGSTTLPIVLNQELFTLYADPGYIKKPAEIADKLVPIVGGDAGKYEAAMKQKDTRYVILAKQLNKSQKDKIASLKYPGIGTQAVQYRTYPQGTLLAQTLGFVNEEGQGKYGIEQAMNTQLKGMPGQLKAVTDVYGVPLAASKDNIQISPKHGDTLTMTVDMGIQQQLESILKDQVKRTKAESASAVIMDPRTGAIKAIGNLPTYNPGEYYKVEDGNLFTNAAVSHAIEVGSTMKPLTTAAALDSGAIRPNQTYYDPAHWKVDDFNITNIEEDGGAATRSVTDILNLSLNTGATWELMQMGGGKINEKARKTWYDYMTKHYRFGTETGVEQGYEASGYVPSPKDNGAGINLTYANTSFGQAMTATPVQMAAVLSAIMNGGTYYQPRLVDGIETSTGESRTVKPKILQTNVVDPKIATQLGPMMEYTLQQKNIRPKFDSALYKVGGKTGTAQIAKAGGGYHDDVFNGTYLGYVGGDEVQYVIAVAVIKPKIAGYAGSSAAMPIFADLAHMLINNSHVTPKSGN
jgi:cell division protein FtsI (penicillin-binding protein 3)